MSRHLSVAPSSPAASATMRANRSRDTGPELALRTILHRRGLRYRVDAPLPQHRRRRSDLLFTRARIAVFVDGCFWHGCPEHAKPPSANGPFWAAKIARNRERDRETDAMLEAAGWLSLRFWEHESPAQAADRVEREWRSRT